MENPKAFVSLNEAITQLAFGKPRSPSEELALFVTDQHKLIKLIDESVHQSETSPKYEEFPRRLPYHPRMALIDRLDECKTSWPPAAKLLRAEAVRQEAKWKRYACAKRLLPIGPSQGVEEKWPAMFDQSAFLTSLNQGRTRRV